MNYMSKENLVFSNLKKECLFNAERKYTLPEKKLYFLNRFSGFFQRFFDL